MFLAPVFNAGSKTLTEKRKRFFKGILIWWVLISWRGFRSSRSFSRMAVWCWCCEESFKMNLCTVTDGNIYTHGEKEPLHISWRTLETHSLPTKQHWQFHSAKKGTKGSKWAEVESNIIRIAWNPNTTEEKRCRGWKEDPACHTRSQEPSCSQSTRTLLLSSPADPLSSLEIAPCYPSDWEQTASHQPGWGGAETLCPTTFHQQLSCFPSLKQHVGPCWWQTALMSEVVLYLTRVKAVPLNIDRVRWTRWLLVWISSSHSVRLGSWTTQPCGAPLMTKHRPVSCWSIVGPLKTTGWHWHSVCLYLVIRMRQHELLLPDSLCPLCLWCLMVYRTLWNTLFVSFHFYKRL